jgi:RNA polymerase sigma-70 factor (ECF subfamily)
VLILYEIEGYRYDEIASLLDISSGTVRSQLHRARRLLRDMLRPSDGMTELEG